MIIYDDKRVILEFGHGDMCIGVNSTGAIVFLEFLEPIEIGSKVNFKLSKNNYKNILAINSNHLITCIGKTIVDIDQNMLEDHDIEMTIRGHDEKSIVLRFPKGSKDSLKIVKRNILKYFHRLLQYFSPSEQTFPASAFYLYKMVEISYINPTDKSKEV